MQFNNKSQIIWSITELVEVLRDRQLNEYDCNLAVSGKRGDGKSTLINKILLRFKGIFNQKKHQVYSRDDVIDLLKNQRYNICWDDEGINSGYKRNFQNKDQQELIKLVTAYRDNYNIYFTAIPSFYSLDFDIRNLMFMHIHIIERGLAVIFIALEDSIHSSDIWDSKNNAKLEEKWQKMKQENNNFKVPYHKMSTFAGYLTFSDLTPNQRKLYKTIKREKRKIAFKSQREIDLEKQGEFNERLYKQLIEGTLTKEALVSICKLTNKKLSVVSGTLNRRLKDDNIEKTLTEMLKKPKTLKDQKKEEEKKIIEETKKKLDFIIPDF